MQKLIRYLALTSASSLVLGLTVLEANPALAASFNFSYTFNSGETLTGMLDGDLQPDGNTVANLSNLMLTYSGTGVLFDRVVPGGIPGASITLNGLGGNNFFSFESTSMGDFVETIGTNTIFLQSGSFEENESINTLRWNLIEKVDPTPVTTSEPGLIAGLVALGTIGLGNFLSKR